MTDEEAAALMPAVDEFVEAVRDRDKWMIEACLHHTPPEALAIICAELLGLARHELMDALEVLHETRGVDPAGLSRAQVWEIAVRSDRRAA